MLKYLCLFIQLLLFMDYQKLKQLIPKRTDQWNIENVIQWLNFIHLSPYIQNFRSLAIDGSNLRSITEDDLRNQIKIHSNIVIKKLLAWITKGLPEFDDSIDDTISLVESIIQSYSTHDIQENIITQKNTFSQTQNEINLRKSVKKKKQAVLLIKRIQSANINGYRFVEQNVKIGRYFMSDILIEDERIQAIHTSFIFNYPYYYIRNQSVNHDTLIKLNKKTKLPNLSFIQMGSSNFKICLKRNQIKIQVYKGFRARQTFIFDESKEKILIGRKSQCDICFITDTTLSNRHAQITYQNGSWRFQDKNSANGSWLEVQEDIKVTDGLIFRVGRNQSQIFKCELQNQKQKEIVNFTNQICKICNVRERNVYCTPCNHCYFCDSCSQKQQNCFFCCEKIISKVHFFRN